MSDHDAVPPLLRPDQMPPLVDQAALEFVWRSLMQELGFAAPQLWLLFIDGDRAQHLLKVEDVPEHPEPGEHRQLARMLDSVLGGQRTCAFLFARPGGPTRTAGDLAWARALREVSDQWPIHLANDIELRVVAPDDLLGDRSGAA